MIMKTKTAYLGFFAAIAIIFGYVETLIPVFAGIPGIKLGLANLSVLIILKKYGFKDAALVSVVRILVIGFLFGNMFSILYSLAGAALSLSVMVLLLKKTSLTTIGISVFGGVTHNIGQLIIAALIVENTAVFYYTPPLLISGVVTGFLIGVLTQEVLNDACLLSGALIPKSYNLIQKREGLLQSLKVSLIPLSPHGFCSLLCARSHIRLKKEVPYLHLLFCRSFHCPA